MSVKYLWTLPHFIDSAWIVHGNFILGSLPYCCGILWQKNLYSLSHFLALKVPSVLNNMQDLTKCVLFSFLPCFAVKKTPLNILLRYECMKVIFGATMWQWLKDTWSWTVWFPLLTLFSTAYTLALLFSLGAMTFTEYRCNFWCVWSEHETYLYFACITNNLYLL